MNHNYLPTGNILAITKIKDDFILNDKQINSLYKSIINYLNDNTHSIINRWCAENGQLEIFEHFSGKDYFQYPIDADILYIAAKNGNVDMIKFMLSRYSFHSRDIGSISTKLLDIATEYNNYDLVKFLMNTDPYSLSISCTSAIKMSIKNNNSIIAEYLIKKNSIDENCKILYYGCVEGNIKIVKILFENCGNDYDKNVLLKIYSQLKQWNIVEYLITIGADINAYDDYVLKICVDSNYVEVAIFLLGIYAEKNIPIPNCIINKEINNINRLLIHHVDKSQYHLFHPDIVKLLRV